MYKYIVNHVHSATTMEDCITLKRLKTLMIVFNTLFWFSGPGVLGLGIWYLIDVQGLEPLLDFRRFSLAAYLLIAVGIAIIIFGVIGSIAIYNENRRLLSLYFICLVCAFAVELASCLKTFTIYEEVSPTIFRKLTKAIREEYTYDSEMTSYIDIMQHEYSCCGIYNWTDWRESRYNIDVRPADVEVRSLDLTGFQPFPASCCINATSCNLTINGIIENETFDEGCLHAIVTSQQWVMKLAGWITFLCSVTQFIGSVLVCCLRKAIYDLYS